MVSYRSGMTDGPWHCRHRVAVDVAIAVFFVLLDTGATLVGAAWWPAHPGTLAWIMLGVQAAACVSQVAVQVSGGGGTQR